MIKGFNFLVLLLSTTSIISVYASSPASLPAGGASGQVLTKNSSNNWDVSWITPSDSSAQYTIGQSAYGGVIYFVYVDSTGTQHALVSATADEPGGNSYPWGPITTSGTAQYQCNHKTTGGYSDWALPNIAQMSSLSANRYVVNTNDTRGDGGFALDSAYWTRSSTVTGDGLAQAFAGSMGSYPPTNTFYARCIRKI